MPVGTLARNPSGLALLSRRRFALLAAGAAAGFGGGQALDHSQTAAAAKNWGDFAQAWASLAPGAGYCAMELRPGEPDLLLANGRLGAGEAWTTSCLPLAGLAPTTPRAIASCFKLFVLGELGRQVAQGVLSWETPLALRDDWKSLPSGNMRYEPGGKIFPIEFYASQMIEYSDNTAADHLMRTLGREQIEQVQEIMGHASPERNVPFFLTREFFAMKVVLSDAAVAAYIKATVGERRELLATEVDTIPIDEQDDLWTQPLRISTVEWFAAPADLCRAMWSLWQLGGQRGNESILDVLALDSGLDLDAATWPYAGFKNGDETGVLSRAWLLQRHDGRWFALAAILNDPVHRLDASSAMDALSDAINLLAATP